MLIQPFAVYSIVKSGNQQQIHLYLHRPQWSVYRIMAKCLYLLCMQHWRCLSAYMQNAAKGWMDLKRNFQSTDKCHVRVMCRPESALRLSQINRKQRTTLFEAFHCITMKGIYYMGIACFDLQFTDSIRRHVVRISKFSNMTMNLCVWRICCCCCIRLSSIIIMNQVVPQSLQMLKSSRCQNVNS